MLETFRSFSDTIRDYELHRSEGLLLRHLSRVLKVLTQTVPDNAKTEAVRDCELHLHTVIRQVDSSLLDEWEKLRYPGERPTPPAGEERPPRAEETSLDLTRDERAFTAAIRARIFFFLRAWADRDFEVALDAVDSALDDQGERWSADRLQSAGEDYLAEHERLMFDPEARNLRHTYVKKLPEQHKWRVDQMLVDSEGHNDWAAAFEVDVRASRARREPVLQLLHLARVSTQGNRG